MTTVTAAILSLLLFVGIATAGWYTTTNLPAFLNKNAPEVRDIFVPSETGTIGTSPENFRLRAISDGKHPEAVSTEIQPSDPNARVLSAALLSATSTRFLDRAITETELQEALTRDQNKLNDLQFIFSGLSAYYSRERAYPDSLEKLIPTYIVSESNIAIYSVNSPYEFQRSEIGTEFLLCSDFETDLMTCYMGEAPIEDVVVSEENVTQ
ncbi:MAG: hypothetical protein Q8Q18_00135 [bacterium]|nr:hypothetical protein [bacterium]